MTITQPSLCMLVLSLEDNIRARDFISHRGTSATNNSPRSTSYLCVKTKEHKVERRWPCYAGYNNWRRDQNNKKDRMLYSERRSTGHIEITILKEQIFGRWLWQWKYSCWEQKRGEYTVVVNQMRWKEIFQRWTERDAASRCITPTRRFTFFGQHERILNPTPERFAKSSKRGIYTSDGSLGQFF